MNAYAWIALGRSMKTRRDLVCALVWWTVLIGTIAFWLVAIAIIARLVSP